MEAVGVADGLGLPRPVSQQIHYSLQAREAEYELVPATLDQGLGVLVWSPLAGGLLSGECRPGQQAPTGSQQLQDWNEPPVHDQDELHDTVEVIVAIAEARGIPAAQVALAWTLAKPGVTCVIVGARTTDQLREDLQCSEVELDADELARLDEVSRPPPHRTEGTPDTGGALRARSRHGGSVAPVDHPP